MVDVEPTRNRKVTAIDIIRVFNKDLMYRNMLFQKGVRVGCSVFGRRTTAAVQSEIGLFSDIVYFASSVIQEKGTPGEEYCGLVQRKWDGSCLTRWETALVAAMEIAPFYLRKRLEIWYRTRMDANPSLRRKVEFVLTDLLPAIDCALSSWFFMERGYVSLPRWLLGSKYEFNGPLCVYFGRGYLLSAINLIHLAVHIFRHKESGKALLRLLLKILRKVKPEENEDDACSVYSADDGNKCSMCLNPFEVPTSTPCGHVFCWTCVVKWCCSKSLCPICRQPCQTNQLLPIWNIGTKNLGDMTTTTQATEGDGQKSPNFRIGDRRS